jgi:hypothetical protein
MNVKWKKWAVLALFLSVPFLSGGTMEEGCPKPVQILPAPDNLKATRMSCTEIELTWYHNPFTNPEGFYVYRKCGDGGYELIAVTYSDPFTDTDVPKGVQCTYYVTAYNSAGESEPSNEASA